MQFLGKLIQYYSSDISDNQKKIYTRHCIQTINSFLQNPKSFDDYALITSIIYGLNSYLHSNDDIIVEGLNSAIYFIIFYFFEIINIGYIKIINYFLYNFEYKKINKNI